MSIFYESMKALPCKVVLPEYQNKGIGKALVQKCKDACPNSEWLVRTDEAVEFYKKIGFTVNGDYFLTISSKRF